MQVIRLDSTASTNTYLRTVIPDSPHGTLVVTDRQTAGRGQRGNTWEATPGMNLTFSLMLHPAGIDAMNQYALSEAVSVAIVATLEALISHPDELAIKWPNDIYYGNSKLAGILIENSLSGMNVSKTIVGVGLNVNQRRFLSDAPNPVSLAMIEERDFRLGPILETLSENIIKEVENLSDYDRRAENATLYRNRLWRREGLHPYRTPQGETFLASILGIAPTGHLSLLHENGTTTTHAFKEIIQVL